MNYKLYFVSWLAACLFMLSGCEQSLQTESPEVQTGILRLNIETGTTGQDTRATVDASKWEGIRTLRIIVSTSGEGIVYNEKVTGLDNVSQHEMTLTNLPFGQATVYVIGNEESLSKTYDTGTIRQELGDNSKLIFVDDQRTYFPQKGPEIESYGLPMSGKTTVEITSNTPTINMELERTVAKICLSIENATSTALQINEVSFGNFFSDRFHMFPEQDLDVPTGTQYQPLTFTPDNGGMSTDGIVVEPGQTLSNLSLYFYPTHAPFDGTNSPYTLSLKTNVNKYDAQQFMTDTYIRRNTQVNILARITTAVGLTITFNVAKWDEHKIDVPSFN